MCDEDEMTVMLLKSLFASNDSHSLWMNALSDTPCNVSATEEVLPDLNYTAVSSEDYTEFGYSIYAYLTPFIITLGFIGNTTSLYIYLTKPMKKVSASMFLSAICISDCLVLMTYVLMDWLHKGLPLWPGGLRLSMINIDGICQSFIICAYMFRFTSAWLILVFTIERFVAVCHPLHKRALCSRKTSKYSIVSVFISGALLGGIKAGMTSVQQLKTARVCAKRPNLEDANFLFDLVYAALITCIPYIVITICNCLILKELAYKKLTIRTVQTRMMLSQRLKVELTLTLLAVSSCFMLLSLPYFSVWLYETVSISNLKGNDPHEFDHDNTSHIHKMREVRSWLYICRTAFYVNYSINIFLYYISGSQYRKRMADLLAYATVRFHTAFAFGNRQGFKRPSTSATSMRVFSESEPVSAK